MMMDQYREMYKNTSQLKDHQTKRRTILLEEQKLMRQRVFSIQRDLDDTVSTSDTSTKRYTRCLMLSEWMMAKPEDIDNFYLVPCPEGLRCSLSTGENKGKRAYLYYKNGKRFLDLKSNLPAFTTLDCVYVAANKLLFILDVISYDGRDYSGCDTSFRFFWIRSKFSEDSLQFDKSTHHQLSCIERFDFADPYSVKTVIATHPVFNLGVKLDGYLFYHKEASYTPGESPLVLWLFPFMFDELFENFKVHNFYHSERPKNYTNYLKFIEDFNENASIKKQKLKKFSQESFRMELEYDKAKDYSDEIQNEREMMVQLEMSGNDV